MKMLGRLVVVGAGVAALAGESLAAQPIEETPRFPSAEDAPVALLVDMTSGQTLFARNANRRFAPASITKVMTAYVAFDMLERGKLRRDQIMTVRPETFREWNRKGSTMYLAHDARVAVDQLLHGITTVSANDGSVVLAEGAAGSRDAWLAQMNRTAASLGMQNSHFGTPNGWPDEGRTFTTANDLSVLATALINRFPWYYAHYFGFPSYTYDGITQYNHDPISAKVPGADGLKTGFTNQAGYGFLGSAERNGRRLILVVATSDTARQRNRSAVDLLEWGFSNFENRVLFIAGKPVGEAKVQGGSSRSVPLVAERPVAITIPAGTDPEVSMQVSYDGPLRAPIAKGEPVAWLEIKVEGFDAHRIALQAAEEVGSAGPLRTAINGILGWFA